MTRAFGGRLMSHRQSWLGWLVQPEVLGEPLGDAIGTARAGSPQQFPEVSLSAETPWRPPIWDTNCPMGTPRRTVCSKFVRFSRCLSDT
jgi:hypothetical protein